MYLKACYFGPQFWSADFILNTHMHAHTSVTEEMVIALFWCDLPFVQQFVCSFCWEVSFSLFSPMGSASLNGN